MATASASVGERLLTAEEYAELSLPSRTELVRGKVVEVNQPRPRHGLVCRNVFRVLDGFVSRQDLGYVFPNDTGFLTQRRPDSVRGPYLSFYSYSRMPKGLVPRSYSEIAPEVIFEVMSPTDRWRDVLEKVVEYLDAGVLAVVVLDPDAETAHVNTASRVGTILTGDDELRFEENLPGFTVKVSELFAN